MNKLSRHNAQELMRDWLIDHYADEVKNEARTGEVMQAMSWVGKIGDVAALENYFDIEDEFFQFLVDSDNRPANLFSTVLNLFVHERIT